MSKLKKFTEFFVSFDEDEDIPAEAGSDDANVAAKAAVDYAQSDSWHPKKQQVAVQSDPYADDDFDIAALERELAQARPEPTPAPVASTPTPRAAASARAGGATGGSFQPKSFDEIYTEAGLPTELSQDFTVFTIEQLLANPHLQNLPDATKTASLMVALQARNVTATQVVEDARNRDHALDVHDADLLQRLIDLEDEVAAKNSEAEARINALLEELRQEMASNNERVEAAKAEYYEWKRTKIEEEERLFNTISHLVEPGVANPVSVDQD